MGCNVNCPIIPCQYRAGIGLSSFSKHGLNQAITRGVNPSTISNTVKNPVVVLLLLTVSDSSLWFFVQGIPAEELGQAVKYKSIMHCFADPIIMLFIGGFILAIAATKSGLDVLLARVMPVSYTHLIAC